MFTIHRAWPPALALLLSVVATGCATDLHRAASQNASPDSVRRALDRGADINAMTTTGETPCDLGRQIDRLVGTAVLDRLCGG